MDKKKVAVPLVCHGHSRPVVDLFYSPITPDGFFLISASKGNFLVGIVYEIPIETYNYKGVTSTLYYINVLSVGFYGLAFFVM